MDYERAVATAPPGWTHFQAADLDRLPPAVRKREWARVPAVGRELLEAGGGAAGGPGRPALFWTVRCPLGPHLWGEGPAGGSSPPPLVSRLPAHVHPAH